MVTLIGFFITIFDFPSQSNFTLIFHFSFYCLFLYFILQLTSIRVNMFNPSVKNLTHSSILKSGWLSKFQVSSLRRNSTQQPWTWWGRNFHLKTQKSFLFWPRTMTNGREKCFPMNLIWFSLLTFREFNRPLIWPSWHFAITQYRGTHAISISCQFFLIQCCYFTSCQFFSWYKNLIYFLYCHALIIV